MGVGIIVNLGGGGIDNDCLEPQVDVQSAVIDLMNGVWVGNSDSTFG